jgi:hypothetical protein
MSANEGTTMQLGPVLQVQHQANTPVNILHAKQSFLRKSVKSMQRDSRSVPGVDKCFYLVTHVHDTL